MKKLVKIFSNILMALLLIMIPSILFGCVKDNPLSVSQAKTLINKVLSDIELQTEENEPVEITTDVFSKIEYDDYDELYVNYNGYYDFVKSFILMAKFAFEGEVQPQTYYKSTAISYSQNFEMQMYFTLSKNVLEMWIYDVNNDINCYLHLDNNPNDNLLWVLSGKMDGTFEAYKGYSYFEIRANTENVVGFAYGKIETNKSDGNFAVEDISSLVLYDCDIESSKILYVIDEQMTDAQILEFAEIIYNTANEKSFVNFVGKTFTDIDFLEKLYIYLGSIQ